MDEIVDLICKITIKRNKFYLKNIYFYETLLNPVRMLHRNSQYFSGYRNRPADWNCPKCSDKIFGSKQYCIKCNVDRYGSSRFNINMLKTGVVDWNCPGCNFKVFSAKKYCNKCNIDRDGNSMENKEGDINNVANNTINKREGDWNCPKCNFNIFASKNYCHKCGVDRNGYQQKNFVLSQKEYDKINIDYIALDIKISDIERSGVDNSDIEISESESIV